MLNKLSSRITIFVFAALLLGGFPNFMMQEVQAAAQFTTNTAKITADNTITITFTNINDGDGATLSSCGTAGTWGTFTPTDAGDARTITPSRSGDTCVLTVSGSALADGETGSLVINTATDVVDTPTGDTWNQGSPLSITDGQKPTASSAATVSSTSIEITMSESDITVDTKTVGDFTISGVASSPTVTDFTSSGNKITLTLSSAIVEGDSPQVNYSKTTSVIDDGTPGNTLDNFSNLSVTNNVTAPTESNGGGSGCNGDCEEPTLGVLPNGQRIVEDGFTYNGHSVDVERFFTPYPLITAQVGKQNTAQFKIYENRGPDNIAHFSFAFGLGKDQIISESKAMIEVDFARDRTQTVIITDPENALDNVSVTTDKVACNEGPTQCLEITIKHMFREPLDFDIVGTDVWDYSRQSWQNYYNHGIEVVGPSMNPPDEFDGIDKGHIYHLIETSKTTAVDEFGNSWTFQYGTWNKDFIKQERIQDGEKMVFDRMHSDFVSYRENLAAAALIQLAETCPLCIEKYVDFGDSTSLEYVDRTSKLSDPQVQMIMKLESQKAQNILKYIMDPKLSSTEKYKTIVELEKDDRPISEILEEERMMKVILQAERAWLKQVIAPNQ